VALPPDGGRPCRRPRPPPRRSPRRPTGSERHDWRTIDQLASDAEASNYRPHPDPEQAKAALAQSARVLACLKDASGMVESAVAHGDAYTVEQLAALQGVSLSLLKRLVCDLAIGLLFLSRPDRKGEVLPACSALAVVSDAGRRPLRTADGGRGPLILG
jgi:hypothetical protein